MVIACKMATLLLLSTLAAVIVSPLQVAAQAGAPFGTGYPINWPLCGKIYASPPAGWDETQGCPANRAFGTTGGGIFHDGSFSSTYGPRQKASSSYRCDFHRGLDIPTGTIGKPVFAIADGFVHIAGTAPGYTTAVGDYVVQIKHYRTPGVTSSSAACGAAGCLYSNYLHLNDWHANVTDGARVTRGQLIGHTGVDADSSFAHLHFEIRDGGRNSEDTVHPLKYLPYADADLSALSIDVGLNPADPVVASSPKVRVAFSLPSTVELDINRVEILIKDGLLPGTPVVAQTAPSTTDGYDLSPLYYDMNGWTKMWSHRNNAGSTTYWPPSPTCPHASDHGAGYDPNYHLDKAAGTTTALQKVCLFNGIRVEPAVFVTASATWDLALTWLNLNWPRASLKGLVVEAKVTDVRGNSRTRTWMY